MKNVKLGKLQSAKQLQTQIQSMSVKRHMGTDYKVEVEGKEYTPQEISAIILQNLKASAEAYLGETVTKAVITVPAYSTMQSVKQRKMLVVSLV